MTDQLRGMDVSKWQGAEHWAALQNQFDFAFCKATEGRMPPGTADSVAIAQLALDPQFRANWAALKSLGKVRGAYHFARPDLGNTAKAEADWFLYVVGADLQPGDLVALDFEPTPAVNWLGWSTEWMEWVKVGLGFNSFFYSFRVAPTKYGINYGFYKGHGIDPGLWLSAPDGPIPAPPIAGWPFVAIQQRASGVPGGDIFFGTRDQLLKYGKPGLAGAGTGVVVPPQQPPVIVPQTTDPHPDSHGDGATNIPVPPVRSAVSVGIEPLGAGIVAANDERFLAPGVFNSFIGTPVVFRATPAPGQRFTEWTGSGDATPANPLSVTLDAPSGSIIAHFDLSPAEEVNIVSKILAVLNSNVIHRARKAIGAAASAAVATYVADAQAGPIGDAQIAQIVGAAVVAGVLVWLIPNRSA